MIIRIVLILGLGAIGWLVFLRRHRLPVHILTVLLLVAAGVVAVISPDLTNQVAHVAGVGRGADLVTYLSIVSVFFVLLHYYTKFVDVQRQLTAVVRELAILRAELESTASPPPADDVRADSDS